MKYVGVDIGGTNLKAGLADENGQLLAVQKMKVASVTDQQSLAWTIVAMTQELAKSQACRWTTSHRWAWACPGPWRSGPAPSATPATFRCGTCRCGSCSTTICPSRGANGMAGEVGHTVIIKDGLPCPCGRRGCWEQYASATALKRMTAEALAAHPDSILAQVVAENDGRVSGQSAFIAARQGDPVGQRICEEYVSYLSCGIVNMVNVFQPDTLAIGGGVSNEADEQLLLPVQRCVERESIPCGKNRRTRIVKAELGNQAGIIGAALLGKNKRI